MPVPTTRAVWLAALSLAPAAVALLSGSIAPLLIAFDAALLVLIAVDFFLAPRAGPLILRRTNTQESISRKANSAFSFPVI